MILIALVHSADIPPFPHLHLLVTYGARPPTPAITVPDALSYAVL